MEALLGCEAGFKHTRSAAVLHNRVGFAFRRAKKELGHLQGWNEGKTLLTQIARWTKVVSMTSAPDRDCPKKQDEPDKSRRVLTQHISNASTRMEDNDNDFEDDDAASCATTMTWGNVEKGGAKRMPRKRPNRRAKKTDRNREYESLGAFLAKESERELDFDQGRRTSEMHKMLVNGLEAILEDQEEGLDNHDERPHADDDEAEWFESVFRVTLPGQLPQDSVGQGSACAQPQPPQPQGTQSQQSPLRGRKRKELDDEQADDEQHNDDDSDGGPVLQKDTSLLRCGWSKVAQGRANYFEILRGPLTSLQRALHGAQIQDIGGVQRLIIGLQLIKRDLGEALQFIPTQGSSAAKRFLDLIRDSISEREASDDYGSQPGPMEWITELRRIASDWDNLDEEMQGYELRDVNDDAENHASLIDFILESAEEFLQDEDEGQE